MQGVRGRIDVFGEEVLPLREADVREAAAELLDAGVRGDRRLAAVQLPQRRARAAGGGDPRRGEGEERGQRNVPVFLSSELYPMRRDLPRLNSTLIEAYAAEPRRRRCAVRDRTKERAPASSCG